ncbi:outer membrane protein assembly factor BamB family protein [Isoptericola sp. NPDC055881]
MARRRGAGSDAYTFDLEPDGDEGDDAAAEVRATRPASGRATRRGTRRATRRGTPWTTGSAGPLLIDLDPADDVDAAELPPAEAGGLTLRQAAERARGFLRGRRLVAAVVVVAAALTAVVVDGVGDRGRLAALRDAPGGVLDLTDEPREVWRVPTEGSAPGGLVGVLGGLVVAQQRSALLGLDVETGARVWSVDLPDGSTTCGPGMQVWSGDFQPEPAERVVCVSGTPDGAQDGRPRSTVTVVDAEGSVVGTRDVGFTSTMAFPGPGGGLLTAAWVGDAAPVDPLVADEVAAGVAHAGAIPDGYDLRVRLEDGATGKVRWERTLPFDAAVDPAMCVRWGEDGTTSGVDLRGGVQVSVTDRVVWLGGCGVDAWFTPDGVRLDRPQDPGTFEGFSVEPLATGGYVAGVDADLLGGRDPESPDRLLRDDGSEQRELRGRYLVPLSTDGGGDGVVLERRGDATVATDADGDELWSTAVKGSSLLVRTAQVAVVVDEGRRVHGLDMGTGEVLWTRPDLVEGVEGLGAYGPRFVEAAFTDGRLAAFVVPDYARGDVVHWVALDAATGRQLWQLELGGDGWGIQLAVAGRLVRWSPTAIVGLG